MKIELKHIKIRDIIEKYEDNSEEGVYAYNGLLNIRPKYQREFVYKDEKRNSVIETINKGFPLNVMYWVKNDDGTFEVLDGQQRTISFCQYCNGDFSIDNKYFHNLTSTEKDVILDYEVMIYFCEGNDKEKLDWFQVINIAGEKLTNQELRNAVYTGKWLTSAKNMFSKNSCAAYLLAKDYIVGSPIRQEILEKALSWISDNNIESYMASHQHDENASELWEYFKNVVDWVNNSFSTYRKEMKGLNWGEFYNKYKNKNLDTNIIEGKIAVLMEDEEIESKKGIYLFILSEDEKYLNLRLFSEKDKRVMYEKQKGICPLCKSKFDISQMEGDHITPWCEGGKTVVSNGQMLCRDCNRRKSSK